MSDKLTISSIVADDNDNDTPDNDWRDHMRKITCPWCKGTKCQVCAWLGFVPERIVIPQLDRYEIMTDEELDAMVSQFYKDEIVRH